MKRLLRFAALWLVFSPVVGFNGSAARAQKSPTPGVQNSPQNSPTEAFVLGPDDVIEVTVRDHSDLDHTLTVLPDGKIAFPTVGELQAAGKTPRDLAAEIKTELETTFNNIRVTVTVKEVHSRRVSIAGPVKTAGGFDLKRDWRVFDLVAAAGGLSAKPETITARIIRGGRQVLPVNLAEAMRAPQTEANVLLERNDLLLLDEQAPQSRQAQVIGQVGKPSVYSIEPDTTLLSLLAEAGNPTDKAALTRVYVLRNGAQIPLNLYPFLMEGKADETVTKFKIQPGDVVMVPTQEARYSVQGQVGKPAYYTYPERGKVTVLDALNEAGGQTANADLSKAGVIRLVDGKYTVIPVNIDLMYKKGDLSKNMALQPGDVLFVPARSSKGNAIQNLIAPLSLLSILGFRL